MANLKDLQEMAKNGEVSKKLLENEEFKSELKKALKEENGVETTDEQITQIIKNFEIALQNEEILKEAELEGVSGGRISRADVVEGVSAFLGAAIGYVVGGRTGGKIGGKIGLKIIRKDIENMKPIPNDDETIKKIVPETLNRHGKIITSSVVTSGIIGELAGAGAGGYAGAKLGKLICEIFFDNDSKK